MNEAEKKELSAKLIANSVTKPAAKDSLFCKKDLWGVALGGAVYSFLSISSDPAMAPYAAGFGLSAPFLCVKRKATGALFCNANVRSMIGFGLLISSMVSMNVLNSINGPLLKDASKQAAATFASTPEKTVVTVNYTEYKDPFKLFSETKEMSFVRGPNRPVLTGVDANGKKHIFEQNKL